MMLVLVSKCVQQQTVAEIAPRWFPALAASGGAASRAAVMRLWRLDAVTSALFKANDSFSSSQVLTHLVTMDAPSITRWRLV